MEIYADKKKKAKHSMIMKSIYVWLVAIIKRKFESTNQYVTSCYQGDYFYESADGNTCLNNCGENQYYYYGEQKPLKCVYSYGDDYILISNSISNICNKTCNGGYIYKIGGNKFCNTKIENQ